MRPLPLGEREAKLARLLARKPAGLVFNEHTDEDGAAAGSRWAMSRLPFATGRNSGPSEIPEAASRRRCRFGARGGRGCARGARM
jgi:hypothetical protein